MRAICQYVEEHQLGKGIINCLRKFMQGVINLYCWMLSVCMQTFFPVCTGRWWKLFFPFSSLELWIIGQTCICGHWVAILFALCSSFPIQQNYPPINSHQRWKGNCCNNKLLLVESLLLFTLNNVKLFNTPVSVFTFSPASLSPQRMKDHNVTLELHN